MAKLRVYVDLPISPDILQMLEEGTQGHELVLAKAPGTSVLSKAGPDPEFAEVDVAFGQPDVEAIAGARRLKWVHVSSSGITRYDTPEFRSLVAARGIALSNSAGVYEEACATHVLAFMLAQSRRLPLGLKTRAASGEPEWQELRYSCAPLRGSTALILGYGSIGKRLAQFLRPLGVQVLAYRRKARGDEDVPVITPERLDAVLSGEVDHVINILPESVETRCFFNSARFAGMKQGAVFYNIGRGATVDQDALRDALRSERIAAAWLDVTEPEPLPDDHPLWAEPNCFITPHVAGGHVDETKTLVRHFLQNFDRYVRGEPLIDRVM